MTSLPGFRGSNSASRVQLNTCCTSTSQLRLKVCQVCRWIGRIKGDAPALRTTRGGGGGEGAAELCAHFLEPVAVAGDPDDVRAMLGQGDGDGAAETPAGAGDQCCRPG